MFGLIGFMGFVVTSAISLGIALLGFWQARRFVATRLRYVDAAHKPIAMVAAGVIAAVAISPIVWLLPGFGVGTALLFGAGVAAGVAGGSRLALRSGEVR
jgi:hypothetical protein